ncbi:type VI secretion system membrane subunit TssM [Janthinobacterium agaricidamnosum]|uniref:Type VI secretion protein IcmF n=1 Tax=Janthinobacterium agaricidamnosum NBRC 102515 = DSM 9628 TaxID=1349767 RepID=W0VDI9_9BURK|nr:type VI secretion system membrane subunit TssM [Janthinobacterium agaricidamnosum]CDG85971.1 conserved hypothetical protein [Janthinobacterium agaricidamnosum NBRC 102515 = DSM 9628]
MKRFIPWLRKPAVLALCGVLLLSLLVWYEAPLLAFDGAEPFASARSRWRLVILMLLAWAGWFGWKWLAGVRASRQLMDGVAARNQPPAPGAQESAAELAALAERMRQAMAVLRKAQPGLRTGSRYMYQLPWYMFIGAPGSGKTTALTQSGLQFPLAGALGPGAVGGIGGTRNCDWWFTDEAVLLDTAGRYTTQDSYTEVDRAAWGGFLDLLKKHRGRRPINGVIVTLSVSDLLQLGESGRKTQALAVRERLRELHERLGIGFPIYVMVTKCDLLAGFSEFFDGMGRDERGQVWGMTFPLDAGQAASGLGAFPAEFAALEHQLQVRLLARMEQERDLQRRGLLYSFPQQFAAIRDGLESMLAEIFQSSVYADAALLRGVYFTSGTQDGRPIDRVMGALAGAFGLDRNVLAPHAASGRSYFLTRLLRDVIFKEADLGGLNRQAERRRQWINWGATAAIGVALVLTVIALLVSHSRNQDMVGDVAGRTRDIERLVAATSPQDGVLALLPPLAAARNLPAGYAQRDDGVALLNRFGLYQGDKLGSGAQTLYHRLLREMLLPRIVLRMEAVLRRGDANNQDLLYETLRVYLMLGDRKFFDAESVQAWLDLDWSRNLDGASAEQRRQLAGHVAALLEDPELSGAQLDPALIAQVRQTLALMPLPLRVYNRLKREVAAARLPDVSINGAAGRDVSSLLARRSGESLTRGLPGLYSVAGYRKLLERSGQAAADVARDNWILDRQEEAAGSNPAGDDKNQLKGAVLQLYFADYIQQWDTLLGDIKVQPFGTLDQAARISNALGAPDSPLRTLLATASRETTLDQAGDTAADASVGELVKGRLDQARKKLESALGGTETAAPPSPGSDNPVTLHFADLHKLATGAAGAALPLDATLAMLKDAALFFDAADSARRSGAVAPPGDALVRLKRAADGKPAPLSGILQYVESAGNSLTLGNERARLSALWAGSGAQFCGAAIAGRYPLVRGAAREITPEDFGKFFGQGGAMDDFFTRNLASYVDMSGAQWRWRSGGGAAALGISQETLDQFQRGARLRDMMFAAGGRQPSLRFDLKPVSADAALSKIVLTIDGQPVTLVQGGPLQGSAVILPSGKDGGRIKLEAIPALQAELAAEGPWAWFRMMDKAVLTPGPQGEKYRVTFDLEGRKAVYELTASSVVNPFQRDALEQFRCPASL